MKRERSQNAVLMWVLLLGLVSQNVVLPVVCTSLEGGVEDQKNYYSPDPHRTPSRSPKSPHKSPSCGTPPPPPCSGGGSPPAIRPPSPPVPVTPPTPPFIPDPNRPPFGTCIYWRNNPQLIWGLLGFWGTVGGIFGVAAIPAFGQNLSLQQALANTRRDGIGSLFREGTASLLNSMVSKKFSFTTQQVKERFSASLASDKAAAAQAYIFKQANEGRLKPRE